MTKLGRALRDGLLGKARALFHGLGRNGEHPSRKPGFDDEFGPNYEAGLARILEEAGKRP